MGQIFAHMTGTSVEWEEGADDPIENHGWIDPDWSMEVLHESRNDAPAVLSMNEDDEELAEAIRDLVVGYYDNGDGTFYTVDSHVNSETGVNWTYAIHFKRKFFGPKGWTEENYIPKL